MSYSFLFGPSGSGKTEKALNGIIKASMEEPGRHFFVLVPEQYGMLMQKRLLMLHPRHASGNVEVMSFNRLAWRVFAELSIRSPEVMDDTGKAMVLRRVAADRAGSLTIWQGRFKRAGFTEHVKSMISEFYQYGIRPEDLMHAAQADLALPLRQKLSELALLYEGFDRYIEDRFLPSEEVLNLLADAVPESRLLRGAGIVLDGFTGFTPVQYRLVEALLKACGSVLFTVTCGAETDPERPAADSGALFSMSAEMVRKLREAAAGNGVPAGKDVFLRETPRFKNAPALAFFEKHFLRYDGAAYQGVQDNVFVTAAADPSGEAERTAEEILRLVRREGMRFRDIAVICADLPGSGPCIRRAFSSRGIPFYEDRNLDVAANPLPELLRSALGCVTDRYSDRSFLRFMKCGLIPGERETMYFTDRYIRECGVRGERKFFTRWEYVPRDLKGTDMEALNSFKDDLLGLLEPLRLCFSEDGTAAVADVVRALKGLIESTGAEETLSAMKEQYRAGSDDEHVREYTEVLPETLRILTDMEELLGGERLGRTDMRGILDTGLNEIRVGQIPAFADRVPVGDLTRSRLGRVKVLFLLGANDGALPLLKSGGCILTDREKEALKPLGIVLAPTAKEDLYTQRYYLYRMLTQPEERLIVSCTALDREGKALRPSGILNHIAGLFPDGNGEREKAVFYYSAAEAERALIGALREARSGNALPSEGAPDLPELIAGWCRDPERRPEAERLVRAASYVYTGGGIGRAAAEALYGSSLSGSVTRIEDYYRCPCLHFLKYGIGLKEQAEFEMHAYDTGNLVHSALEILFRRAAEEGRDITAMDDAERDSLADACVDEAVKRDGSGLYSDSARNGWIIRKLGRIVRKSVRVMAEQLSRGDFRTYAAEQSFGLAEGFTAMNPVLSDGSVMRLRGKVDRVDIAEDDGRMLLKIVDYKSGSTKWEPWKLLSGTQIQLILYLDAMEEILSGRFPGREIIPAAVLYAPLADPFLKRAEAEDEAGAMKNTLKALMPSGLVNVNTEIAEHLSADIERAQEILPVKTKDGVVLKGDSTATTELFGAMKKHVRGMVAGAGEAIREGSASAHPVMEGGAAACAYCPYAAVCGFDKKTGGYEYRTVVKKKPEEVYNELDT